MFKKLRPVLFILFVTFLIFFKVFTRGEFPYPGDLLVSFNFPWYSGGWEGYDSWTTHKEFIAMDAIRQHLPWHKITFGEIKTNFSLPLWNPYNFSGTPHLANMQTFIFNPFNIFFLVLPLFEAWILFIVVQVPLTIYFTYLFARGLKLSKPSSLLAGIAFVFSSYLMNWLEIGIVGHGILWMPLMLFSTQRLIDTGKVRFLLMLILSSSAAVFAGHIQTTVFIFITAISYSLAKIIRTNSKNERGKNLRLLIAWLIFTFLITAIQTIPALELYLNSPLSEPLAKHVFSLNTMPLKNLVTLFAPDFFGNPVTNNFWSVLYGDATPHVGVLPLLFAIFAIFVVKKWEVRFFSILALVFLLYTTRSPLFLLLQKVSIPFLTGTTAARSMFVFSFALSILSAFGLEEFISNKKSRKTLYMFIIGFTLVFFTLALVTYLLPQTTKDQGLATNLIVSRRNLILPILVFISLPTTLMVSHLASKFKITMLKNAWILTLFAATIFAGIYQFNKGQPTSPKKFFFPEHPVFTWLKENGSINRSQGEGTAKTWNNISGYFNLYSAEGYGVFRIKRYAELFTAQESGQVPTYYERSTAEFSDNNITSKNRLYDLTGVKYVLLKDDSARDALVTDPDRPENTKLAWQEGKFKIYERTKALPRFWLTNSYQVRANEDQIIKSIFDPDFDLRTIILEKEPNIQISNNPPGEARLTKYAPNELSFDLENQNNSLFFISDTYYPGWNAYVDGEKTEILRADYTFRAVPLQNGSQVLEFKFEPISFKIGLLLTLTGLAALVVVFFLARERKIL